MNFQEQSIKDYYDLVHKVSTFNIEAALKLREIAISDNSYKSSIRFKYSKNLFDSFSWVRATEGVSYWAIIFGKMCELGLCSIQDT